MPTGVRPFVALAAVLLLSAPLAMAQDGAVRLTLADALARVRQGVPDTRVAAAAIRESEAALIGAAIPLPENPEIEIAAGPRFVPGGPAHEVEVRASQWVPLGGLRAALLDGARAGIARARAEAEDALRQRLGEVAESFARALHAREVVVLAGRQETLASDIQRAAERRHAAGDVPAVDVHLARAALSRARADAAAATAEHARLVARLGALLGMSADHPVEVAGDLATDPSLSLQALRDSALARADLRAAEAGIAEGEARARLGDARRWPDLGLGIAYANDEGVHVAMGVVSLRLPVFDRGQAERAEGLARAGYWRAQRDATAARRDAGIAGAWAAYRHRLAAVDALSGDGLAAGEEGARLVRMGYDAGEFGLDTLLPVQQHALEMQRDHLDRRLEAALAEIELRTLADLFP